ncbi:glyoxylate reductase/hydroxypyruvate reductase-like [Trichogramma pretiosum]|uniref:glyoxylate reductase/hydroxypyruvate reductase-like n=1 Tax=Trichogramma pretiosum TaxID=7493 RepID=UPI0006C99FD2|nr:glyoxylate reductase/hydroxypyruvate reductase-like [Trichogramma pretiosum]
MSEMYRVLVTSDLPSVAIDLLKTKCEVTIADPKSADIAEQVQQYDALLGTTRVDGKFLDSAGSRLRIVATPSAGYDHLDVEEIKRRGIRAGHSPRVLSAAVAEVAVCLLIMAARRMHEGRQLLEAGKTQKGFQWLLGHDLRHKTVGIVGLGDIGTETVKRLKAFAIDKFLYTGHSRKKIGDDLGAEFVTLDALLRQSDFVINCVPLTKETTRMFDDAAFAKMKKDSVFVNIGRGLTVDTEALVRALKNGTIYAAGLDVTDPEPLPVDHELLKLPNAVVLPHMGSQTVETREDMAVTAVKNVLNFFEGKPLLYEI